MNIDSIINLTDFKLLSGLFQKWYLIHQRDLPWRHTKDPYLIWISEIILQQTRVNQGLDYYFRFVDRFPDVLSLANADEDEVLKYWQGLGYYSRARNLHKASKIIATKHLGDFPLDFQQVLQLPGVGVYTASAICSFAFNQPYAVVDGNVYRVLSRIFNIDVPIDTPYGQKIFSRLADALLDVENPGIHNQSVMEFGALHCIPTNPDCERCTFTSNCLSFAENNQHNLPVKSLKIKTKDRYFNYLHIKYRNTTFIGQRQGNDIWKKLWEFPLIESNALLNAQQLTENPDFVRLFEGIKKINITALSHPIKHILTHQKIMAQLISIEVNELNDALTNYKNVSSEDIDQFAVSRLMQILLENHLT